MLIHARLKTNVSKQTLLDGIDIGPPKQRVCWHGLNRSVPVAMNNISKVKVHFKACSENVNIYLDTTCTCTSEEKEVDNEIIMLVITK